MSTENRFSSVSKKELMVYINEKNYLKALYKSMNHEFDIIAVSKSNNDIENFFCKYVKVANVLKINLLNDYRTEYLGLNSLIKKVDLSQEKYGLSVDNNNICFCIKGSSNQIVSNIKPNNVASDIPSTMETNNSSFVPEKPVFKIEEKNSNTVAENITYNGEENTRSNIIKNSIPAIAEKNILTGKENSISITKDDSSKDEDISSSKDENISSSNNEDTSSFNDEDIISFKNEDISSPKDEKKIMYNYEEINENTVDKLTKIFFDRYNTFNFNESPRPIIKKNNSSNNRINNISIGEKSCLNHQEKMDDKHSDNKFISTTMFFYSVVIIILALFIFCY